MIAYDLRSYERNFYNCVEKRRVKIAFITAKIIASLDFISAVTGPLEPTNDQLPASVASWLSWLERRAGVARSRVQTTLKS